MGYGWEGVITKLVPLDESKHFENALLWLNDPEVTRCMMVGDLPTTRLMEEEYFRQHANTKTNISFAIETLESEHIGFCGLHSVDLHHRHATTGSFIGRRDLWGRGYGSDAVAVRTKYAFEVLDLRILTAEVFSGNPGSLRMLEKNGYLNCGVIPKRYYKRGAFHDAVIMVRSREP